MKSEKYIPALGYDWLTRFYDPVVGLTTRENIFKAALVNQADIEDGHHVLDLACGTGTLTMMLKQRSPNADVVGIDGDGKILGIAKRKADEAELEIRFDEGMSFSLPYMDKTFDRVVSSLFFHHLTPDSKLQTLRELKRVLKPHGEVHIADWGLPANWLMKLSSRFIQILDGYQTTADSFGGRLPELMTEAGLLAVAETNSFNTLFGTIRLHRALKPRPLF
ncbi:MAG: class I SAM-dependent methyltransferase [Acidobacteria bacterium]|nr:class I SAM-dependent methyltransferase [Acidobacteriota bacterium]